MPIIRRFPCRLGILIPSKDRLGGELPGETVNKIKRMAQQWFDCKFKGDTTERVLTRPHLIGRYDSKTGEVVVEELPFQFAQCTLKEFEEHSQELVALAEEIAETASQDCVAIYFNQEMLWVGKEG